MHLPRVISGMRPTGLLHLGHYHGVLENWVNLQQTADCYFFAADWHALTTHYEDPRALAQHTRNMVIDWLAAGLDPNKATIFVQSDMPEHAALHVLLSMSTPLPWLERVPTYKDQQEKLADKDLSTYGFLGYPLLQSADILLYGAQQVPVGADQVAHVELTREIARRFNHLYGRESDLPEKVSLILAKLEKDTVKKYQRMVKKYQEQGDMESLKFGHKLIDEQTLSDTEKSFLNSNLDGTGRTILIEPTALLTAASKMPGLDGQKMSKSYGNTITLRDTPAMVTEKIKKMPTDPARIRRTDAGNPAICPVYALHTIYSDNSTKDWINTECPRAGIGCLDCKQPVIAAINQLLGPMQVRAAEYAQDTTALDKILREGAIKARDTAKQTLHQVRHAMGLIGSWSD